MKSENLFKKSKDLLPGGVSSPVRAFQPYPFFAKEGKGSHLWDVDGKRYIDYCLAYGPLILGHAAPNITNPVYKQLKKGTAFGVPTENEIELAEIVVDKVPCAEMIRFVNSGTEATMSAIRLARGFTGKNKIVKFEGSYHGAHDYVLVKSGSGATCLPDSAGVPSNTTENTLSVPFNDEEALIELIEAQGLDIAAIIVEPVMGNVGCIKPKPGYLKFLREITVENDILLIFDEVITGFRISEGGAQEYYGVIPDIVTLGKIIGGGFPMGAFAGSKEIMERISPLGNVYQAGTFNGNPISITAGLNTLKQLDSNFYKDINKKGELLRNGIKDILQDLKLEFSLSGIGSMFQIYFTAEEVYDYQDAKKANIDKFMAYFHELLKQNIFIPPSQFECCFLSKAHTLTDLTDTLASMESALNMIQE